MVAMFGARGAGAARAAWNQGLDGRVWEVPALPLEPRCLVGRRQARWASSIGGLPHGGWMAAEQSWTREADVEEGTC